MKFLSIYPLRTAFQRHGKPAWGINKSILAGFGTAFILLAAIGLTGYFSILNLVHASDWVQHTHLVIQELQRLENSLLAAESARRAFSLTGELQYRNTLEEAAEHVAESKRTLLELTADNPRQQQQLRRLEPLVAQRLELLRNSLAQPAPPQRNLNIARGDNLTAQLREVLATMRQEENRLLGLRNRLSATEARRAQWILLLCSEAGLGALVISLLVLNRNVLRRRRAEESLRRTAEQHQLLADLVAQAHDATIVRKIGGEIISWNRGAENIYGWKASEVLGKNIHELLGTTSSNDPRADPGLDRTLVQEGRWEGELWHSARNGARIAVESRQLLFRSSDGVAQYILEANRDITERLRTAEILRESERRFRATFDNAAVGIANVGAEGNWMAVNQKLADISGYTREELLSKTFQTLTFPEDLSKDLAQFLRLRRGECDSYILEKRYVHKAGHLVWVMLSVGAVRSTEGQFLYGVSVIQDISIRKRAQEELQRTQDALRHSNAQLEMRVAERTASLHDAMVELEQLSYSMIHDLRAPLRAVQSFGAILAEDTQSQLSAEGVEILNKMRAAVSRMDLLVCDVLNYTKVLRGELSLQPVEVAPLARGIVDTYPNLHPPKASVRVAADLPVVVANSSALTQCLSNLLENAVKFSKPGQPPRVELKSEPAQNGNVRLVVEDKGIGIAPEFHSKVFGMFQRLSTTSEGTGIGLAIVKKAVERMGGQVGLESTPGEGSRFWIELKAAA